MIPYNCICPLNSSSDLGAMPLGYKAALITATQCEPLQSIIGDKTEEARARFQTRSDPPDACHSSLGRRGSRGCPQGEDGHRVVGVKGGRGGVAAVDNDRICVHGSLRPNTSSPPP